MQQLPLEEIVKIQPKGLFTIPKKFRTGLFEENGLARVRKEKGRLILEPVRTLPYPVRSYSDEEIKEFVDLDAYETKELKAKGLL
ncbi:hypothetical protein A3A63_00770 [Candidatus Gottesmanbacteria bacterium RIFCSPLOWO2_01_FULL_46_9]|uniref:SpoVT-AbrB domain-containing protein n=1 Tax=Candidatus Gottesmanbacteria bacterium RIFCSPLOWO2_01_FULL_46_9 TaxID=1798394 RepID=A0A1F6B352_9BACT|nr:MAG: hypothetical protein A3A63_00770 [Candidatus Gottesmanbacteria bacterium RIFCSPLOWO2_01_FULL_46_9]